MNCFKTLYFNFWDFLKKELLIFFKFGAKSFFDLKGLVWVSRAIESWPLVLILLCFTLAKIELVLAILKNEPIWKNFGCAGCVKNKFCYRKKRKILKKMALNIVFIVLWWYFFAIKNHANFLVFWQKISKTPKKNFGVWTLKC